VLKGGHSDQDTARNNLVVYDQFSQDIAGVRLRIGKAQRLPIDLLAVFIYKPTAGVANRCGRVSFHRLELEAKLLIFPEIIVIQDCYEFAFGPLQSNIQRAISALVFRIENALFWSEVFAHPLRSSIGGTIVNRNQFHLNTLLTPNTFASFLNKGTMVVASENNANQRH